ncbi:FAD-dependent oxidoreductase [Comamonadaceae bacterium G21597-S1]|nr:FAD-dependent oxidoreductase [Comamonadaceae bacterium G21597-S1]
MACASPPDPAWLRALDLPQAWRGHRAWRVLDTDFGHGERLLPLWRVWRHDPQACHMLHLVVFARDAPEWAHVQSVLAADATAAPLSDELASSWAGLLPGFHRFVLHGGRLQLTLCIGETQALLRQQCFHADSVVAGPASGAAPTKTSGFEGDGWDGWTVKALARVCRRGSRLSVLPAAGLSPADLSATGWVAQGSAASDAATPGVRCFVHEPAWQIKTTRARWPQAARPVSHCVVVGAGLAGAAVAAALSLRGWQVTVLDAQAAPAAGASGLPVGLFAPQLSRDDGPRSRLSRAGIRATLQVARRLLRHGQDWAPSGVAHVGAAADPTDALPRNWPAHGHPWAVAAGSASLDDHALSTLARAGQFLWHTMAGWIKPRQLVAAWLRQPGVRFQPGSPVQHIARDGGAWRLFGPQGQLLAEAPQLVIAGAGGSPDLLQLALSAAGQTHAAPPLPLTPVDGQVTWAKHTAHDAAAFPQFPVNGSGSVAAHVPWHGATAWFAGATYEPPGRSRGESRSAQHEGYPYEPPGRSQGESRSAQHGGEPSEPPGRSQGEPRSAQHEGYPHEPPGRSQGESRSAQHEGYPSAPQDASTESQAHAQNLARLAGLLPEAASRVARASAGTTLQAWRGTRWTVPDRLPVAGAWPMPGDAVLPGLWLSTAMGSRGLTHAALCGELIAAQMGAEPLPIDADLLRSIDVGRFAGAAASRSPAHRRG